MKNCLRCNKPLMDGTLCEDCIEEEKNDTTPVVCCSCGETVPKNKSMAYEKDHWCDKCFIRESDYLFEEQD